MVYNFQTDDLKRARAALILYAMYRSRESNSSLNGVDTWPRFSSYVKAACIKSNNMAQFVQEFCRKANVASIKPKYLNTGDPVQMSDGSMIAIDGINNFHMEIVEDDSLLNIISNETVYLGMLVRERIQREKLEGFEDGN